MRPPAEPPEGAQACGWPGTFVGLPEEFWVVVTIGIMNQHSTG